MHKFITTRFVHYYKSSALGDDNYINSHQIRKKHLQSNIKCVIVCKILVTLREV